MTLLPVDGSYATGYISRTRRGTMGIAMGNHASLPARALRRTVEPADLPFADTREIEEHVEIVGQGRALEALEFGVGIRGHGYGVFVLGPSGSGRHRAVLEQLGRVAATGPVPSDQCYVHNFENPRQPTAIALPAGRGIELRDELDALISELQAAIPAAFESEDYNSRREAILAEFKERQERRFHEVSEHAEQKNLVVVRTPDGLAIAPTRDGEVLEPDAFERLPEEQRQSIQRDLAELRKELQETIRQMPKLGEEQRERLRQLDREVSEFAIGHLLDRYRQHWADQPAVLDHLAALHTELREHSHEFRQKPPGPLEAILGAAGEAAHEGTGDFSRYRVNVLVDHHGASGAPVIYDDLPTATRLIGRVEHVSQFGALMTNFRLIRAGSLHLANGGYLVLDALKLLTQPFAYDELKRALSSRQIRIESIGERLGFVATVTLEPRPISLDVKVVLIGDRLLYYLLSAFDPEFRELFKVQVDFDDSMPSGETAELGLARLFATVAREEGLRPLDRTAVARLIEHAHRMVGDQLKLSAEVTRLRDLVREADYHAGKYGRDVVCAEDVQNAVDARERRSDRLRERIHELVERGTIRVEVEGARVGQVNGLSVIELGGFAFGTPSRITARVRLGKGEIVDIEREVELGGPLHSKGVMTLAGFLGQHYTGDDLPLSLSATLVFEQSYGGVEGDSASSAELYALLSALAKVPLTQSIAVTGSVDQHGNVQAIGGVNEKIEGFFDVCRARKLPDGTVPGVLIPTANVEHLMLRQDVVDAVAAGRFRVHAVDSIAEGIEILSGMPAGESGEDGSFPDRTFNRLVEDRLRAMALALREFGARPPKSEVVDS